ncbi:DUF4034 domain-containing protein [Acrocarpospora catenulata]|uniref:DUF4034 domain-containing protein n=1 Tax=Acrocarpospora catenulata TaxID=2836182 RepID=UPI001BDA7241|nr:DUF4034 domain-containing protein [Acrocarpospora catenulata]
MGFLFGRRGGRAIDPCMGDPDARVLWNALAARDWRTARDRLTAHPDPDVRTFYFAVAAEADGVQDWIDDWIAAEPDSTLPLLVKGVHGVHWAWEARGTASAEDTTPAQFRAFFARLKIAEDCLDEVVERDPDELIAWSWLVRSARGREVGYDEIWRRFDEVLRLHPYHELSYVQMLQNLCAKWTGSDEEMFTFAREAVAQAPEGSPIGRVIADAHLEYAWGHQNLGHLAQPHVVAEIHAAADRSIRHRDFRRRQGWQVPVNVFALVFTLANEYVAAADQFQRLDGMVTAKPWESFDEPVKMFRSFQATVLRYAGR